MAGAKIQETRNDRLFEIMAFNRDVKTTVALEASMKKHGWIDAFPMLVRQNGNGKLLIMDGHHRFEVAQRLGIPFKYVICNVPITMQEINDAAIKWSLDDFLTSYVREGRLEYVKTKEYVRKTGISVLNAISMLYGQTAGSNNVRVTFKQGNFSCKNTRNAEIVGDIVTHCRKQGIAWATNSRLVAALSKVVWVPTFDALRLKNKIKTFPFLMKKEASVDGYVEMIESIYNYKSQDKTPLKFLADKAAKERNPTA